MKFVWKNSKIARAGKVAAIYYIVFFLAVVSQKIYYFCCIDYRSADAATGRIVPYEIMSTICYLTTLEWQAVTYSFIGAIFSLLLFVTLAIINMYVLKPKSK